MLAMAMLVTCAVACARAEPPRVVGTLQSSLDHVNACRDAGVSLVTVELIWNRYEPRRGEFDSTYSDAIQQRIEAFRSAGMKVQLDLGMQYPPAWMLALPNARYVNQFGEAYVDESPGKNIVNGVFNQAVRDAQAAYVARLFRDLGHDFFAVRLGWGYFGEMGYPAGAFKQHTNCYWGFDALAHGKIAGLPATLKPCPVPDWTPGVASADHTDARRFGEWYLASLADYERWQIASVRRYFAGPLPVLLGSWGLRTGDIEHAVANDLGDAKQTEFPLGYDFDRLAAAIDDPKVVLYTTWIDSNPEFGDDAGKNPARWSPVHYLAVRAAAHRPVLQVWGENTGNADVDALRLSFSRARTYHLNTLLWAFEPQLFDGHHATLAELADQLRAQ
jgi:hypothetical protein